MPRKRVKRKEMHSPDNGTTQEKKDSLGLHSGE